MSVSIQVLAPFDGWEQIVTDDGVGYVSPETGSLHIPQDDGSVVIRPDWRKHERDTSKHSANLAETLDTYELGAIAERLLDGISADLQSRADWDESIARAIELLGLQVDTPQGDDGASSAPLEGMSNVRHPLLLESVIKYQAEFIAEMLPADGPVKVRCDGKTELQMELANRLQDGFNHYLTATATEYYPDTSRMAFRQGLVGCAFKKVYRCPLRKRPVSETVFAEDLIVSNDATDLRNAQINGGRVTHRIPMRTMQVKRLIKAGVYIDAELGQPTGAPTVVEQAIADQQGARLISSLPEDQPHTIYECYTELDIEGDHKPYVVTMDKDSRVILSIRRNWDEDNDTFEPRGVFVMYPYVMGLGFYPIGLMHILANTTLALTAAWRLMIDSGMFSNFPGFLYSDDTGRQNSNVIRVAPGSGQAIQTNGKPIQQAAMPLPYQRLDQSFIALMDGIAAQGRQLGGMAQIAVNEGRADVPVGTMLAMIEQQLKPVQGVFKMLHRAQAEEFQLLRERFKEDPEAFWRGNKKQANLWDKATFLAALEDTELVPAADPNTASQVARLMKAGALFELAKAAPHLFRDKGLGVAQRLMRMAQIPDGESLLLSAQEVAAQGQGLDPRISAQMAAKAADLRGRLALAAINAEGAEKERQFRAALRALESHDRAADRESRENVAQKREDIEKLQMLDNIVSRLVGHEAQQDSAEQDRLFRVLMSMLEHRQDVERNMGSQPVAPGMEGFEP